MKVCDLISYLQTLEQDRNIFIVYDRMQFLPPDVDVLSESDLNYFTIPDYIKKSTPVEELPHIGDYFFDAY